MSRLTELLAGIFSSEKAIITDDGQRVVSLDTILPEVEGLKLFDEEVPTGAEDVIADDPIEDVVQYATSAELQTLIERLTALEKLVSAVDTVNGGTPPEPTEIW